jgi:hypothetical protein
MVRTYYGLGRRSANVSFLRRAPRTDHAPARGRGASPLQADGEARGAPSSTRSRIRDRSAPQAAGRPTIRRHAPVDDLAGEAGRWSPGSSAHAARRDGRLGAALADRLAAAAPARQAFGSALRAASPALQGGAPAPAGLAKPRTRALPRSRRASGGAQAKAAPSTAPLLPTSTAPARGAR